MTIEKYSLYGCCDDVLEVVCMRRTLNASWKDLSFFKFSLSGFKLTVFLFILYWLPRAITGPHLGCQPSLLLQMARKRPSTSWRSKAIWTHNLSVEIISTAQSCETVLVRITTKGIFTKFRMLTNIGNGPQSGPSVFSAAKGRQVSQHCVERPKSGIW